MGVRWGIIVFLATFFAFNMFLFYIPEQTVPADVVTNTESYSINMNPFDLSAASNAVGWVSSFVRIISWNYPAFYNSDGTVNFYMNLYRVIILWPLSLATTIVIGELMILVISGIVGNAGRLIGAIAGAFTGGG